MSTSPPDSDHLPLEVDNLPPPSTEVTPQEGSEPENTVYERAVRILLECILVNMVFIIFINFLVHLCLGLINVLIFSIT